MGNNPWSYIALFTAVIAAIIIGSSVLSSWLVSVVARRFAKKTGAAFQRDAERLLPGKNCGDCGCQSCAEYANAVLHREAEETLCPHGEDNLPEELNACLARLDAMLSDPTPPKVRKRRR